MDGALIAVVASVFGLVSTAGAMVWKLSEMNTRLSTSLRSLDHELAERKELRAALTDVAVNRRDIAQLQDTVAKLSSLCASLRIKQERAEERQSQGEYGR